MPRSVESHGMQGPLIGIGGRRRGANITTASLCGPARSVSVVGISSEEVGLDLIREESILSPDRFVLILPGLTKDGGDLFVGKLRVGLLQDLVSVSSVQDVRIGRSRNSRALGSCISRRIVGSAWKLDPNRNVRAHVLDKTSSSGNKVAEGTQEVAVNLSSIPTIHDVLADDFHQLGSDESLGAVVELTVHDPRKADDDGERVNLGIQLAPDLRELVRVQGRGRLGRLKSGHCL